MVKMKHQNRSRMCPIELSLVIMLLITHNMTVWILARNENFFHGSGLNKDTYAQRHVISCVMKASACHHTLHYNHWHCLSKIPPIIAVKSNFTIFIQVLRFIVNRFYCCSVAFTVFKPADIKGVRQRLMSTTSLDDGHCEATIQDCC